MVKVKATTILETVIAMTIILIVFLIAGTIFVNISKSGLTEKKIMASAIINNCFDELQVRETPYENTETINGFLIQTTAADYPGRAGVAEVHCRASDSEGGIIAEQKRLIVLNTQPK